MSAAHPNIVVALLALIARVLADAFRFLDLASKLQTG